MLWACEPNWVSQYSYLLLHGANLCGCGTDLLVAFQAFILPFKPCSITNSFWWLSSRDGHVIQSEPTSATESWVGASSKLQHPGSPGIMEVWECGNYFASIRGKPEGIGYRGKALAQSEDDVSTVQWVLERGRTLCLVASLELHYLLGLSCRPSYRLQNCEP